MSSRLLIVPFALQCVLLRFRPEPAQKGAERVRKNKGRSRFIVLCVAPAVILFFIFMILPTLNVFRMSLYERGAYSPTETFVGMANFQALLQDTQFIRAMQNTILMVVIVTIITFALALIFARSCIFPVRIVSLLSVTPDLLIAGMFPRQLCIVY